MKSGEDNLVLQLIPVGGIEELISLDISEDMIKRSQIAAASDGTAGRGDGTPTLHNIHIVGDEEYLPLKPG